MTGMRRRALALSAALAAALVLAGACTPAELAALREAQATRAASAAEPVAQPAPPPPGHCADYENMEAGRGHPTNQHWFNHLDARGYARVRMACVYAWGGGQYDCLDRLWTHESGWDHRVWNRQGSGAYGIPQSLPASKMASHGDDYMTNPRVQVRWGLDYIRGRYGAPTGTGCRGPY
jgi:peptidoglycan DL-endopeptidase CwlO